MSASDEILGEFIDAWKAGRRPDVDAYLQRVPEAERDTFADALEMWLEIAPTPDYDEPARAAIAAEPALRAAFETAAELRTPLPQQLPTLRARAGLAIGDVAARLAALFGTDEDRTEQYLARLEHDELDERRLSRRLLGGLAAILGADPDAFAAGGPATGQAFYRAEPDATRWVAEDIDALSRAALAPAPSAQPMDELDRLFLGGPDA